MRARLDPVEALVTLPRLTDAGERRAAWRQALTALGQHVRVTGPPPLDGSDPADVARAAGVALATGLVDEADFLGPDATAIALYELSAALPAGSERRELGRRVFSRLYEGTAGTFAAVAVRMARTSARPLDAPPLRARIGLVLDLPAGSAVNADALALTLVSRRELFERWVERPSLGPLPARRLAAIMFEHAAREAVVLAQQGDRHGVEVLTRGATRSSFSRLLADREPLVWRHVAVARGLLAGVEESLAGQIELGLDPALTPTEWRRAAVSLVATLAWAPELGMKSCRALLESAVARQDPGIVGPMLWGLPRVIETEPDAAEDLLDRLCITRRTDVVEGAAALLSSVRHPSFGRRAVVLLRAITAERSASDPALAAALERLEQGGASGPVGSLLARALDAYESDGARAAFDRALEATAAAETELASLVEASAASPPERLRRLHDLDASLLERPTLHDLLLLARRPGAGSAGVPEVDRLYERLGGWLLDETSAVLASDWTRDASLFDQRRLRALLHLIDVDTADTDQEDAGARQRIRRAIKVLSHRLGSGPDSTVHRILAATLARTFEAAVREGVSEPSDLLLVVARELTDRESVRAIEQASTNPELAAAFGSWVRFLDRAPAGGADPDAEDSSTGAAPSAAEDDAAVSQRVVRLSQGLGAGGSYRGEALRQVVLRMGRALEVIASARGLSELVESSDTGMDPLGELEASADAFRKLAAGAARRVLDEGTTIDVVADVTPLSALVERTVGSGNPAPGDHLNMAVSELVSELPLALGESLAQVATRLDSLPVAAASDVYAIPLERRRATLPDWLLPRRTIGAFYVVRPLGSGGASSVFMARRLEERHDARAEAFALKVPQYDPTTARSLSEQEFLSMFRDEASALLALPAHPNLARFVTFDMAARPKPILVMELIRGAPLDRLIRSRSLRAATAMRYLDGILTGLDAMHRVGVGHLDVKPSNVILRDGETPVLVDFGLSGRQLRPGCGTLEYCAPEVLGVVPDGHVPSPRAADVYAFACLAFELLTGESLFTADDEVALMSAQISHDGWPDRLAEFGKLPEYRELAVVLAACLRRDPRDRPRISEIRAALAPLEGPLAASPWPFPRRANQQSEIA
ncbi:MAG: serine/threonine-protein kinase [Sorangiineae bacterium]|nr:serine/threonine-protein kinase [Polyangiaceae bacterium]MEB2324817.1 serine/threonine-protein kinase [Sorangiineae bacterium]